MTLSVHEAAREVPNRVALTAGGHPFTFAELSARVAEAERELGGARDATPLAVVARRDLVTVVRLLALIELQVPFLPLAGRIPKQERERRAASLGARILLDGTELRPLGANESRGAPPPRSGDERPLAVVPTTGTTGGPKGVLLSRRAFLASAEANARNLGWRAGDAWLLSLPLHHVGGLSILTRCLLARARVVVAEGGLLEPFDARRFTTLLARDGVTLLSLVPAQLARWLDGLERDAAADLRRGAPGRRSPSSLPLRAILVGGGAASPTLLDRARRAGLPVLATYGMTETCSQIVTQPYGEAPGAGAGLPLHGVELRVRDGRIETRGPMLFSGYVSEGEAFLPGGWFGTGDLGRIDEEGRLHVEGRASERIRSGGESVDPRVVEAALTECAQVAEALVFGVPDETWGERVAAALVPRGAQPDLAALDEFARQRLAPWERPRLVTFLPRLPRHPNGKVDRARAAREARPHLRPIR